MSQLERSQHHEARLVLSEAERERIDVEALVVLSDQARDHVARSENCGRRAAKCLLEQHVELTGDSTQVVASCPGRDHCDGAYQTYAAVEYVRDYMFSRAVNLVE